MSKVKKICVVINNRANYARIKSFLLLANKNKKINLQVVLAGSSHLEKFGDISHIIKKDKIKVHHKLFTIFEGNEPICMTKTTSQTINELSTVFLNIKPDIVFVLGDRYENLAVAISASYMNIPLAHVQGGEVTGSIDESVRHAITKLSHIHFTCTKRSKKFILKMGESKKNVFLTGCPSIDLIKSDKLKIDKNFNRRNPWVGNILNFNKPYLTFLLHAVTTEFKENKEYINNLIKVTDHFSKKYQIVILWPNVDSGTDFISKRIRLFLNKNKKRMVAAYKNFSPEDYLKLLKNTSCLVGNSSSGIRESAYLGLPVVNIGNRQTGRERGLNVIDTSNDFENILKALNKQLKIKRYKKDTIYGDGKAGKRILDIILKKEIDINKKLNYLDEKN